MANDYNLIRETWGINHTYNLKIELGNVSPRQLEEINKVLDILGNEEIDIKKYTYEND